VLLPFQTITEKRKDSFRAGLPGTGLMKFRIWSESFD
jgi:hypothetical protein